MKKSIIAVMLVLGIAFSGYAGTVTKQAVNTLDQAMTLKVYQNGAEQIIRIEPKSTVDIEVEPGDVEICIGIERLSNGEPITDVYRCRSMSIGHKEKI